MSALRNVLTLSCANRPGIVAKVSTALFEGGFNILDAQQFDDTETGNFFMRVIFDSVADAVDLPSFRQTFADVAAPFSMNWSIRAGDERKKVLILVSRFDHCLVDLLYRWRSGELPNGCRRGRRQLSARYLRAYRFCRHSVSLSARHQADQARTGNSSLGSGAQFPRPR